MACQPVDLKSDCIEEVYTVTMRKSKFAFGYSCDPKLRDMETKGVYRSLDAANYAAKDVYEELVRR